MLEAPSPVIPPDVADADVQEAPVGAAHDGGPTFRFDDGYWEDAFSTLYDPCMRVCSGFGC